jgi:hypothetical protein
VSLTDILGANDASSFNGNTGPEFGAPLKCSTATLTMPGIGADSRSVATVTYAPAWRVDSERVVVVFDGIGACRVGCGDAVAHQPIAISELHIL